MFLTPGNVLLYLVQRRFASLSDAVSGGFTVESFSRRNRNLRVRVASHDYFVKQVETWNPRMRSALESEASLYRQSQMDEEFAFLRSYVPPCFSYDPAASVLILGYLADHSSVYHSKSIFDPQTAQRMGRILATFHNKTDSARFKSTYSAETPWCFSLHKSNADKMNDLSGGRRDFVRTIKRYRDFASALERLQGIWRPECLTHADCKLDNWLVNETGDVRLIDWECIRWGDAGWDAATLLQSYWNVHVRAPDTRSPEQMRPAMRALVRAYGQQRGIGAAEFMSRIIPFAGVRMLQSSFELLETSDNLTPPAMRLTQAGLNVMTRPEWAADYFLGDDWPTLLTN